ncbi:MAG: Lsm family RNA-binding protein [Candidatus Bathyarchaeia archaeon]
MSTVSRRYIEELSTLLQKEVIVDTINGQTYTGILSSFNPDNMSVCLSNAKDDKGRQSYKLFINGSIIARLYAVERPYDLRGLAERLERVFPKLVRLYEEQGVIVVMDRIRVTEKGVIEGSGPAAERVQRIYEEFMRETKA